MVVTFARKSMKTDESVLILILSGSCHSPGLLEGLIHGTVRQVYTPCIDKSDIMSFLQKNSRDTLTVRGHSCDTTLRPIFEEALQKVNNMPTTVMTHPRQRKNNKDKKL